MWLSWVSTLAAESWSARRSRTASVQLEWRGWQILLMHTTAVCWCWTKTIRSSSFSDSLHLGNNPTTPGVWSYYGFAVIKPQLFWRRRIVSRSTCLALVFMPHNSRCLQYYLMQEVRRTIPCCNNQPAVFVCIGKGCEEYSGMCIDQNCACRVPHKEHSMMNI